jgi:hypothetical protein
VILKEKAAGMLDTSATAFKNQQSTASLPAVENTGKQARKDYATMQAKFARLGRMLNRVHRAQSGRITVGYIVSHSGATRHLNTLSDVVAHLAEIRGYSAEIDSSVQGDHGAVVAGRAGHADHAQ